ncbi:MAG: nucleoside triphosphate pyrophosphohydrolase [Oscillospiraceae bacterium]|nr:nucleoside triphosphate pyrophosphohydrolase [Oscillospiraceae bacterium]
MEKEVYPKKEFYNISDLLAIVKILRGDNGCAWDKEQDHHSIRMDVLEEAYEVMEAIDSEDSNLLKEELGDLLLQVVFHAELETENDSFDFDEVCDGICKKLIYRHPHVFGNIHVENSDEVLKNWDSLKSKSKGEETATHRLESVPKLLPSLMRGQKVCKRASNAGLDIINKADAIENIKVIVSQLETTVSSSNGDDAEKNLGNLLFACCNLASLLKKDGEKALTMAINQFIMQFRDMEDTAVSRGITIDQMPQNELKALFRAGDN